MNDEDRELRGALLAAGIDTYIFDLGGVLLDMAVATADASSERDDARPTARTGIRDIYRHPLWKDFETGHIDRDQVYARIAQERRMSPSEVGAIVETTYASLRLNPTMVEFAYTLRAGGARLLCVSNTPRLFLLRLLDDFPLLAVFDAIYVSSLLGMRKPSMHLWQYVLEHSGAVADRTLVIDDTPAHLESAARCGMNTLLYDAGSGLSDARQHVTAEGSVPMPTGTPPSSRAPLAQVRRDARSWLARALAARSWCASYVAYDMGMSDAEEFSREIFSTLIVLHARPELPSPLQGDLLERLVGIAREWRFCFFTGLEESYLEPGKSRFPEDVDTTSMACLLLLQHGRIEGRELRDVARTILANSDERGVIQVYLDRDRPRVDPVVCSNALHFLWTVQIHEDPVIESTLAHVQTYLESGEWLQGTRYYPSPDAFLYFLSKLVLAHSERAARLVPGLRSALVSRIDSTPWPIDRAMRVSACCALGMTNKIDFDELLTARLDDGAWPMNGLFLAAKSKRYFGSRELTTALAQEAMANMTGTRPPPAGER